MKSTIWHSQQERVRFLALILFLCIPIRMIGADEPSLQIQGADEKDGVKVTVESSSVSLKFLLQTMNATPVKRLRVVVGGMTGPDGRLLKPNWWLDGKEGAKTEVDVPGLREITLLIETQLPLTGNYAGSIDLIYGMKRHPVMFTITRADVTVPVNITTIDAVRSDSCWTSNTAIRVALEGTRSEKVTLDRPLIENFALKDSDKVRTQAQYDGVSISSLDSNGNQAPLGSTFELNGQTPSELLVTLLKVDGPGEYTGTFVVGSGDWKRKTQDFTVYVRKQWWVAAFFIMLGVAASFGLRRWAKIDRPRLLAERQIAQLSNSVDAVRSQISDATEAEQRVLESFSVRLAALYENWERGAADSNDNTAKEIEEKLNLFRDWVNMRRRFDNVHPPQVAAPLRQGLLDFESSFSNASSADELKTLRDRLNALSTALANAIQDEMVRTITDLMDEATKQKDAATGVYADRIQREVLDMLSRAKELAQKNQFAEAGSADDRARLAYAGIMAAQLEDQLPSDSPDPRRITKTEWDALSAQVRAKTAQARTATDPETAITSYVDAYTLYLSKLLEALRRRVSADLEKVDPSNLADDKKAEWREQLNQITKQVDSACAQLTRREVAAAILAYQKSKDAIEGSEKEHASGLKMGAGADYVAPPNALPLRSVGLPSSGGQGSFLTLPQRARRIHASVATLDDRIKRNEVVFTFVVGAVSILTGVLLLWVPSPTWGGLKDCITAVLWGLGLHQVSDSVMGSFDWSTMIGKLGGTGGENVKS